MADPTPDSILFRCHACRQKFAVKPSRIGSKFKCTKCQAVVQVPKESSLDNAAASKPTVKVQTAKVRSNQDSVSELSFDDLPALSGSMSAVVDAPPAKERQEENPPPPASPPESAKAAPESADGKPKPPTVVPPGKKACPNCGHVCPGMALSCPLCQHRFEAAKPKPKPKPAGESGVANAVGTEETKTKGDSKTNTKALSKAGSPALKPKRDLGKVLDNAITVRGKGEGRPVEPPMWMDEKIYGSAFKLGLAGLCCLGASLVIFIQLDSPESARNAFFLIRWMYQIGGRWIPSILCLAAGITFMYLAIKPVVDHLKRERELQKPVNPFDDQ